jgi:hypothetical protein
MHGSPPWLRTVGSREEIAEWLAINRVYRGWDRWEREREFIYVMRQRHPDMPTGIDEELQLRSGVLMFDPGRWKRETGEDDPVVDQVLGQLTPAERVALDVAVAAIKRSWTLAGLAPNQQAAWQKAKRLYQELDETSQTRGD